MNTEKDAFELSEKLTEIIKKFLCENEGSDIDITELIIKTSITVFVAKIFLSLNASELDSTLKDIDRICMSSKNTLKTLMKNEAHCNERR